jgi:hypothetical protein
MTRQALPLGPTAISDANGNLVFLGISPALSQEWVATFSIPGSPGGAIWTLYVDATLQNPISDWVGKNTYGPINVAVNQQIVVGGTNLVPHTQYQLTLNGVCYTEEPAPFVFAQAAATNNLTMTQFLAASGLAAGPGVAQAILLASLNYPPGTTALSFHAAIVIVKLTGVITGELIDAWLTDVNGNSYFYQRKTFNSTANPLAQMTFVFPLGTGSLGQTSRITVDNHSAAGTITIDAILDQEPIVTATLIAGVTVAGDELPIQLDAEGPPNQPVPSQAVMIAGSDGVLLRVPTVVVGGQPVAVGSPVQLIGGIDPSGNARFLKSDTFGVQLARFAHPSTGAPTVMQPPIMGTRAGSSGLGITLFGPVFAANQCLYTSVSLNVDYSTATFTGTLTVSVVDAGSNTLIFLALQSGQTGTFGMNNGFPGDGISMAAGQFSLNVACTGALTSIVGTAGCVVTYRQ